MRMAKKQIRKDRRNKSNCHHLQQGTPCAATTTTVPHCNKAPTKNTASEDPATLTGKRKERSSSDDEVCPPPPPQNIHTESKPIATATAAASTMSKKRKKKKKRKRAAEQPTSSEEDSKKESKAEEENLGVLFLEPFVVVFCAI